MPNQAKKDPIVQPVIWSIVFLALTVGSAIFFVMNTRALQDYDNPKSKNYDPSGLGQTISKFMGHVGQAAMILFGLITLIFLLVIFLRIRHNKSLAPAPITLQKPDSDV